MKKSELKKYCEHFEEMKYTGDGYSHVIARGKYEGYKFLVVTNRGQHPCAYVDVFETTFKNKAYEQCSLIYCHGDLTYSSGVFELTGEHGWWLGWDYGHIDDYIELSSYTKKYFPSLQDEQKDNKKWTTKECVEECINVISQVIKLEANNKKISSKKRKQKNG